MTVLTDKCRQCDATIRLKDLPVHTRRTRLDGSIYAYKLRRCAECRRKRSTQGTKTRIRRIGAEQYLWESIRTRARQQHIEFDLTVEDIVIPHRCPVLGILLTAPGERRSDSSPSVDRFDPTKGYVRGNICVMSLRANRIKNDATRNEIASILDWMDAHECMYEPDSPIPRTRRA